MKTKVDICKQVADNIKASKTLVNLTNIQLNETLGSIHKALKKKYPEVCKDSSGHIKQWECGWDFVIEFGMNGEQEEKYLESMKKDFPDFNIGCPYVWAGRFEVKKMVMSCHIEDIKLGQLPPEDKDDWAMRKFVKQVERRCKYEKRKSKRRL